MKDAGKQSKSDKIKHALGLDKLSPGVRKVLIGIVGGVVLFGGIILIFIPGPAFIVIPLGLAILATEFEWAKRYLRKARRWLAQMRSKHRARKKLRTQQRAAT